MTLPALQKNSVFFRKILSQFPQDFSLAFAYGSAVFRQNGSCQGQMRNNLYKKPCKYFDQGRGTCPFGGKCFYMHAYADGTRAEPDKPRKQLSAEGNVRFLNSVRLWDFIEEREHRGLPQYEDEVNELGELFMQLSGAEK